MKEVFVMMRHANVTVIKTQHLGVEIKKDSIVRK